MKISFFRQALESKSFQSELFSMTDFLRNKLHFSLHPRGNRNVLNSIYLTDIPRQREEYEVIYGTRRNAECHITSILRAGVEYLFYFMTNPRYTFVTK